MQKLIAYSAISTKIRAMQGKLLTDSDFKEIAESSSVTEALTVLESIAPMRMPFRVQIRKHCTEKTLSEFYSHKSTVILQSSTALQILNRESFLNSTLCTMKFPF